MSLPATHLRFALAIREDLGAADLEHYVSGAVYPDTRYLTGVPRRLTHDFGRFAGSAALTDFEKGWLAHLLGDRVFRRVSEDAFPDLFLSDELDERWTVAAAVKTLQDAADAAAFDLQALLAHLDYYELHFHEDERKVIEYNESVRATYAGKIPVTVEDCFELWRRLGVGERALARLRKKLIELAADASLVESIGENFGRGMELYRAEYRARVRAGRWDAFA